MTASSFGPKDEPEFKDTDAPDVAVNPTQVAKYAALVGNRKAGTSADRKTLTGNKLWPGLEYFETDTGTTYVCAADGSWRLVSSFTMAIPAGVALPQNSTTTNAPPAGTPLQMKLQYAVTGTNGSGVAAQKINFQQAFPNACLGVWMTTVTGSAQNPVINAGLVDRAGFTPTWPASPNVTVGFVYLAIGW